jgi:hypothetical protein
MVLLAACSSSPDAQTPGQTLAERPHEMDAQVALGDELTDASQPETAPSADLTDASLRDVALGQESPPDATWGDDSDSPRDAAVIRVANRAVR